MPEDSPHRPLPEVDLLSDLRARVPGLRRGHEAPSRPPASAEGGQKPSFGSKANGTRAPGTARSGGRRAPRAPTLERLWNVALYNIEQRETSSAGLRRILTNRVLRYAMTLEGEARAQAEAEGRAAVEETVARAVRERHIDDARFAEMKARSWRAKGWGERRIALEMRRQGMDTHTAQDALGAVDAETVDVEDEALRTREADWEAAQTLCKRKRIGRFRRVQPTTPDERAKVFRREMGTLARAGFSGDVVKAVLGQPPVEEWD